MADQPFWIKKSLTEMTQKEWESLCDGCGKCCLHKLQDEDTDELHFTNIACQYLDADNCQCQVYETRQDKVPDCVTLTPDHLEELIWLPSTCAYRLLYEGKTLPEWHPLVSGDTQVIHVQHMSVKNKVISESEVDEDDWPSFVIDPL